MEGGLSEAVAEELRAANAAADNRATLLSVHVCIWLHRISPRRRIAKRRQWRPSWPGS